MNAFLPKNPLLALDRQRKLQQAAKLSVQKLLKVYIWTEKSVVIGYFISPKGCSNYNWTEKSTVIGYSLGPKGCFN